MTKHAYPADLNSVPLGRSVYYIRNRVTGRLYIGSSGNSRDRLRVHWAALFAGKHKVPLMQSDCDAHGIDSFEFGTIENLPGRGHVDDSEMFLIERMTIFLTMPQYNIVQHDSPGWYRNMA